MENINDLSADLKQYLQLFAIFIELEPRLNLFLQ